MNEETKKMLSFMAKVYLIGIVVAVIAIIAVEMEL